MSSLTPLDKHAIEEFIGESSKCFTKLYSAKENGFDAGVFHQKCDNRGPTLTVISDTEGHVYGGYTSVSWQSAFIPQVYDRDAFLFYRDNGSVQNMEKFSVRKCESAIAYDQTSGPIFGSEPDLGVFTGNVTRTHDGTPHAVSLKFKGASYMMPSYPLLDLEVEDIVVYSVTDSRYNLKALPWRNEPSFDNACLRTLFEDVESYWPLKDFGVPKGTVQYVNILFVGPIGAGKSTFINTVDSVFRGYATMIAIAGGKGKCMTHRYRQYHLTSSDNRRYLHFRLCDTRGLEDGFSINKDFDAILEGHVPDKYNFDSLPPAANMTPGYRRDPQLKDKIHCVVYVLDAEKYSPEVGIGFTTDDVHNQIIDLQKKHDQRGIPQLILLNKTDFACPLTKKDTSAVNRSEIIKKHCLHAAERLGLPPLTVLPMKNNFFETTATSDEMAILTLYNVRQMLRAADAYLRVNFLDELRQERYETSV